VTGADRVGDGRSALVSVVMAVHNGEPYVAEAVRSIQNQSLRALRLLVIDDGSTDGTVGTVEHLAGGDERVEVLRPGRIGLVAALNLGLERVRSPLVWRMDADDVAHPRLLELEVRYLDAHPEIGLIGAAFRVLDRRGRSGRVRRLPLTDLGIRWLGLLASPFADSATLFRRELITAHDLRYADEFPTAQDYDFWMRMLEHTRAANLGRVLLQYRVHDASITRQRRASQLANSDIIAMRTMKRWRVDVGLDAAAVRDLRALFVGGGEEVLSLDERLETRAHSYLDLFEAFVASSHGQDTRSLAHYVAAQVAWAVGRRSRGLGPRRLRSRLLALCGGKRTVLARAVLREGARRSIDRPWLGEAGA
jgi:glycosyltransferase involved in cell wall biosynthesis